RRAAAEGGVAAGALRRDLGTVRLVNGIDEESGSTALLRPQRHRGQPPGCFTVMVERALSVDKDEIEIGRCELLPIGLQRQLGADVDARLGGEKVELAVDKHAAVVAEQKGRVDEDSFHST